MKLKLIQKSALILCSTLLSTAAFTAHAAQVTSFSPQGEIAKVRQVVIKFDEPMVPMGDPTAAAPFILECNPKESLEGQGRWIDEKNWAYDFSKDLPVGVTCTARAAPTLDKSVAGNTFSGPLSYTFNTGGPFVDTMRPWSGHYSNIAEDQSFLMRLNGDASAASIKKNVWCSASSIGERINIKLIEGQERQELMDNYGWGDAAKNSPNQYWAFQCVRQFNADDEVAIIYDIGVESLTGLANGQKRIFEYEVRSPFTASFTCTRENSNANCMPLADLDLTFNSLLPIQYAEQITLKSEEGVEYKPSISKSDISSGSLARLTFSGPFPEETKFTIILPKDIQDDTGRKLNNADQFPLNVATDTLPSLAKFAAAPFGIIELYAEPNTPPMVPLTIRNIEHTLNINDLTLPANRGTISQVRYTQDIDIINMLRVVDRLDSSWINRNEIPNTAIAPPKRGRNDSNYIQSRLVSLLGANREASKIELPAYEDGKGTRRPMEVVGIPVTQPGYHVLELASPALGSALVRLPEEDEDSAYTMYVRTGVLVTNLSVHAKIGRENSMIWVTHLNSGLPVSGADVNVRGCDGTSYASGKTDEQGILTINKALPEGACGGRSYEKFLFISARAADEKAEGGVDMAFTLSNWYEGIEPWRFGYPTNYREDYSSTATTVFDRTLLRAGETVSMKHFIRDLNLSGFDVPANVSINTVKIVHQGSGQEATVPIHWDRSNGGLSASSIYNIPETAKLGTYKVFLINDKSSSHNRSYYYSYDRDVYEAGSFQVEEFRLPVFEGNISITSGSSSLVQPKEVPLAVQVNYLSGGGASELPVQISAVVRPMSISFPNYNRRFSFNPAKLVNAEADSGDDTPQNQKLIADKLPLALDTNGAGGLKLAEIPVINQAQDLLIEASFADPNGEIVTLRRNVALWPSAVVAGIRNDEWVSITDSKITLQAIALDTTGTPKVGVPLEIRAQERITTTTRKRLVGGFYAYDSNTEIKDLGSICSGQSDEQGLLTCEHKFTVGGNIELIAVAKDEAGRAASATTSLWVTSRDELWFGGSDSDRIDLLPENPSYKTGETAKFQLRMPFRSATALVTVEREGIIESHVMQLSGNNPTIALEVKESWGPNVYISALVLRGRLTEVPLYSFFNWGYKEDDQWWQEYQENLEYAPPTAMVDLSKPAYRMGVAEIKVIDPSYQLDVKVNTEKPVYQIRESAKATITVLLPDGTPAANADVALAVVDEALLELKNNTSWNLLENMLQRRSWGVQTSTAQMEVVGRRHYGLKAVAAGGGGAGAGSNARELFDTLLIWEPTVKLDAKGQATVEIPINDSLTAFRVVVIAAHGASRFGTGVTRFQSTQDLQLISGLPPVIRGDDTYRAAITVRNASEKAMRVDVSAKATGVELKPLTLEIPANSAREAVWTIEVPAALAGAFEGRIDWEVEAKDTTNGAQDAIKVSQRVMVSTPITVRQATLKQLDGTLELPVKQPIDGIEGRGGIRVSMVPRLADGLPAIDDWFNTHYPYSSLEFQASKALATRNVAAWNNLNSRMPAYLDEDGLPYYFLPNANISRRGSDTLAAYLLSSAHEASKLNNGLALSSGVKTSMINGLTRFAEGKLQREFWSPKQGIGLEIRRINAMEALSRYDAFKPRMLSTITIAPNQWPTTTVIQWLQLLQRTPAIEKRTERLEEAQQILRSRLDVAGTRMGFSTESSDYWWWMMWNSDMNAAYLLLATLNEPTWQDDLPKLVTGFIARQQTGAWHTTTSNLWGGFALEQFSRKFESIPVAGFTRAQMVDDSKAILSSGAIDWKEVAPSDRHNDIGTNAPSYNATFGAPSASASFVNNEVFLAWPTPPQQSTVILTQDGTGRPWATIQSLAAVPLKAPFSAGYSVTKTITPINEQVKGAVTRGDVWRVRIDVNAQTDMTWVIINDPIPGGATILGTGLGRDSEIATSTPTEGSSTQSTGYWWNQPWLAYKENAQDGFRAYYEYVPKGEFSIEYTVRLNNEGTFVLPPTRVEAIYAPEMFGETPNATVTIKAAP